MDPVFLPKAVDAVFRFPGVGMGGATKRCNRDRRMDTGYSQADPRGNSLLSADCGPRTGWIQPLQTELRLGISTLNRIGHLGAG